MILMIDNYDSFTYNLVQEFGMAGADMKVVKNDEIDVAGIAALKPEAIVLSPGPGNPDSAGITLEAIKAFAGKVPMMGVCLGHQSIAQAFGGRIVPAKRLMHGKTSQLTHDGKGLFAGFAQEGFFDLLAVIHVTAHGGIPVARQQVLGHGTFLQVEISRTVQDMQMHHGMQGLLGSMAPGASRLADDDSVLVHQRQHFAGKRRGGRPERRMREYGGRFIGIQQFKHG